MTITNQSTITSMSSEVLQGSNDSLPFPTFCSQHACDAVAVWGLLFVSASGSFNGEPQLLYVHKTDIRIILLNKLHLCDPYSIDQVFSKCPPGN